jgi:hypothetical protein
VECVPYYDIIAVCVTDKLRDLIACREVTENKEIRRR